METNKLDRSELWNQLQNAHSNRSNIDQVFWNSYSIFWATNAVLLVALFSTGKFPDKSLIPIIISIAGMLQSFIWVGIQYRLLAHLKRADEFIKRIEVDLGLGERHAISYELAGTDHQEFIEKGINKIEILKPRIMVPSSICIIGIAWVALLIYTIFFT